MLSKRKTVIGGIALLVSLTLLFASAAAVYSSAEAKPLASVYYWGCNANDECGRFYNSNTGGAADGLWAQTMGDWGVLGASYGTSGEGVYGYASGTGGTGVYAYAPYNNAVVGSGGSGSGDYGGLFAGYEGVRGMARGTNGYGTWGSASGTYGIGGYGYASGTRGYGLFGYSSKYIAVRGVGYNYGGYFSGCYGVMGIATCSSGKGVYGYASTSYGEGVRGTTGGQGGDGLTGTASSSYGYGVDTYASGYGGVGIRAYAGGTGGWAGVFSSGNYRGIYANGKSGYYDGYFPDMIYAGGTVVSGFGLASVVLNDGSEALEPGDLVAFTGFIASDGSSGPTMGVTKVNGANSGAIIGVVQSAYVMEAPVEMQPLPTAAEDAPAAPAAAVDTVLQKDVSLPEAQFKEEAGQEPPPLLPQPEVPIIVAPEVAPDLAAPARQEESLVDADAGHFVEGSAKPGQYVVVTIQGIARVKVDASAAPIRVGDTLTASRTGYAITASNYAITASKADAHGQVPRMVQAPPMIIGRALESLEKGTGTILVFVSVR